MDPVGFLANEGVWSLIAYCHLRNDRRLFRLHRIQEATTTSADSGIHDVVETLGAMPHQTHQLGEAI